MQKLHPTPSSSAAGSEPSHWADPPADVRAALLEEYKTLRQEILNHQGYVHQYNTLGVTLGTGFAALLTFAPAVSISPTRQGAVCIAFVLMYFFVVMGQAYRRMKEMRIGRYIQYFIEPRLRGLNWESIWDRGHHADTMIHPALYEGGVLLSFQACYGIAAATIFFQDDFWLAAVFSIVLTASLIAREYWVLAYKVRNIAPFRDEWTLAAKRA